MKSIWILALVILLVLTALIGSCSSADTTVQSGDIYAKNCAGCHGSDGGGGRGPAVIGAKSELSKYGTAEKLFDVISTNMPANNPGSLSRQDYLEVLDFILIQNKYISEDTSLDESQLNSIALE
jgi:mono/diheme cytochrome c family protein